MAALYFCAEMDYLSGMKQYVYKGCFVIACLLSCHIAQAAEEKVPASRIEINQSFAPIVRQTAPAVVNIYTKRKVVEHVSPFFNDPFFNQFFGNGGQYGMSRERLVSSLGSGVIVDANGTIITNYHVAKDAQDISVVLNDKREMEAKVVVTDQQSDLAILSVDTKGEKLPFLTLHDSDTLEVGDLVLAIGNPFGVGQTVTSGIISALSRSSVKANDFSVFIQTDAAINPGNSGGALVDIQGRLIGIPTAIYSRSGGSNGIGFAIPSNMVQALLSGDRKNGHVVKPWLGAQYQTITKELAESLKLKTPTGVLVSDVFGDGPADKSGMKVGDVIVAINGHTIDDVQGLRFRTAIAEIGELSTVDIIRKGEKKTLSVILTTPPEKPARDERVLKGQHPLAGFKVANLNPALALELQLSPVDKGVVIVESKPGARAIAPGDIVQSVNNIPITSAKQLDEVMQKKGHSWRINMLRDGNILTLSVMP